MTNWNRKSYKKNGRTGDGSSVCSSTTVFETNYPIPLPEYLELYKAKKSQDKLGGIYNEELRVGLLTANETAIAAAEENAPYYPNPKGIREARAQEKKLEEVKNSINKKLGAADSVLPLPTEKKETIYIPQNIDEAFDLF